MHYESITFSGHVPIRCFQCGHRLGDAIDLYGRVVILCYRCKALVIWRGASVDHALSVSFTRRNARRKLILKPFSPCPTCKKYPIFVALFRGSIERVCRSCKGAYRIDRTDSDEMIAAMLSSHPNLILALGPDSPYVPPLHKQTTSFPSSAEVVALMEERWAAFAKARLREKGRIAVGLRFEVFKRDGFRCRYCGRSVDDGVILHADHVIPESKGGPTTLDNLATACFDCNIGKSNKDLSEEVVLSIRGFDIKSGPIVN